MNTKVSPDEFQMGLMEHLRELRKRPVISLIAVSIGTIVAYSYAGALFSALCAPYLAVFGDSPLIGTSPSEAWVLKLKVAVFAGGILVSPILFQQFWLFVAPGLYERERKMLVPFVVLSTGLFTGGALFCYHTVLPLTLGFFKGEFDSINVQATIRIGEYLSMAVTTLVGFGAVFELPLVTHFLARAGVIDHRFLIDWFRHAVIVIFAVSAVLTPPDVLTQFLMAGPLLVLYGISIGVAYLANRGSDKAVESTPSVDNKLPKQ